MGALVLALAIAALVLGVVKGEEWGWLSGRVLSFAVAVALGALFARRCARHRAPIVDLSLPARPDVRRHQRHDDRHGAGFYGYTLVNVLFLTAVWQYSVLEAGLAMTPDRSSPQRSPCPPAISPRARPAARPRRGRPGGARPSWLVTRVGMTPDFLGEWLPAILLLGVGAGALPPTRPPQPWRRTRDGVRHGDGAELGRASGRCRAGRRPRRRDPRRPRPPRPRRRSTGAGVRGGLLRRRRTRLPVRRPAVRVRGAVARRRGAGRAAGAARRHDAFAASGRAPGDQRRRSRRSSCRDRGGLRARRLFAGLDAALRQRARPVRVSAGERLFREGESGDALLHRPRRAHARPRGRDGSDDPRDRPRRRRRRAGPAHGRAARGVGPGGAHHRPPRRLPRRLRGAAPRRLRPFPRSTPHPGRAVARDARPRGRRAPARPPSPSWPPSADCRPMPSPRPRRRPRAPPGHRAARLPRCALAANGSEPPASTARCSTGRGPHDLVVLDAGAAPDDDGWTGFCLQQADRILLVAAGFPPRSRAGTSCAGALVAYDVAPGSGALAGVAAALEPVETPCCAPMSSTRTWRASPGAWPDGPSASCCPAARAPSRTSASSRSSPPPA